MGLAVALTAPATARTERRGLAVAFLAFGGFWGAWAAVLLQPGQRDPALVPMRLTGRLVDRRGARLVVPAGLAVFALAVCLPGLAHSALGLLPALVLLGASTGVLDVSVNASAAVWERLEDDHLMGVVHGAFSTGVLIGSASAGVARQAGAGPEPVLLVVGAVLLAAVVLQPRYRPAEAVASVRRKGLSRPLLLLGALTAGAFLVEDAVQSWSALHLERGLHAGPAVSGAGPALFAGAMAVGRFGAGPLQRRSADDRLVVAAGSALSVGVLVVALAPVAWVALVGLVVAGAGTSLLAPLLFGATGRQAAPGAQASDLGTVSSLGYGGFLAGPPLVGAVSAALSLPVAIGLLSVIGVALAAGGRRVLSGRLPA